MCRHPHWPCRTVEGKGGWLQRTARPQGQQRRPTHAARCAEGAEQEVGRRPAASMSGLWRVQRHAGLPLPCGLRWPPSRRGMPAALRGGTNMLSTASCTPPHKGKPFAMTSMHPSSGRTRAAFRSRTRTCVATVAPASRHTLATARHTREGNGLGFGPAARQPCHLESF